MQMSFFYLAQISAPFLSLQAVLIHETYQGCEEKQELSFMLGQSTLLRNTQGLFLVCPTAPYRPLQCNRHPQ